MPPTRVNMKDLVNGPAGRALATMFSMRLDDKPARILKATLLTSVVSMKDESVEATYFPRSDAERTSFRTNDGKKVTLHQWAVYDYILNIPKGNVATYKSVCSGLGQGSPRSVGSALRNNPFAPFVPCHRVISSDLYLGGYCGEWGPQSKTGTQFSRKLQLLRDEGVEFDEQGILVSKDKLI